MIRGVLEGKLGRRYRDESGLLRGETAEEVVDRVAETLGKVEANYGATPNSIEAWTGKFRQLMLQNVFWPSGRILNNCGSRQSQLASCFVLPLPDDFDGIFHTLGLAATCHRSGGGTGFDLSDIREQGARILSAEAAGSSGPVSWLRLFDSETFVTAQGGKMRGANLASLSVRHPDVFDFIDAKQVVGTLTTFNLSVAVDDAFMETLEDDGEVDLVSPFDGRVVRRVRAQEVWHRIAERAWRTGDPGVLFPDSINRANPLVHELGPIRTTNPCGEQTLYAYEASNLGSINLAAFLRGGTVDWPAFEQVVSDATRLLDNAIDASRYPDPRITDMARGNRRLGLGVMGFADMLIRLGIPYDSERALALVDEIGSRLKAVAWATSHALAVEREPFENWGHTGWSRPARNLAITTIAPTGTISMVAGCSSGIEPRFASSWNKDVLSASGVDFVDEDLVDDVMDHSGKSRAESRTLVASTPVNRLPVPTERLQRYRYAHDVSPDWHVRVAARWQTHTDNAVSKTVNLPFGASVTDAETVFRLAWESGCKGISLYREGSRERDLLEVRSSPAQVHQSKALLESVDLR